MTDRAAPPMPWHVIHGEHLLELLRRAHAGENPDHLYIEEYANAEKDEDGEEED